MGTCPTDLGFRAYRMGELRTFLSDHDVDRVWMDYLHWHAQFEDSYPQLCKTCFNESCLGLDFDALAPYVDVFSPMPYHGRSGMPLEYVRNYVEYFSTRHNIFTEPGKYPRLWPIVQAFDSPRVEPEELATVLEYGLAGKSSGVMAFTIDSVAADPGKIESVKKVYTARR